jgi:membrane-bound lytic murein transglycosylase B
MKEISVNKKQLLKSFQDLKQEIEKMRKKHVVQGLVDKFHTERKSLEKKIEKTVSEEVKKAKKFMNEQKKELDKIQKKVEVALKKKKTTKKK